MITLKRTNSGNIDFINLVAALDRGLKIVDGNENAFYDQFNKIDHIKYVVVAYDKEKLVGCGAIKIFDKNSMEIKRMFVTHEGRKKGIATKILAELEDWASALNFKKCVLETGKRQIEAVALYTKNGYQSISNYGQYKGVENSLCFEKNIGK